MGSEGYNMGFNLLMLVEVSQNIKFCQDKYLYHTYAIHLNTIKGQGKPYLGKYYDHFDSLILMEHNIMIYDTQG